MRRIFTLLLVGGAIFIAGGCGSGDETNIQDEDSPEAVVRVSGSGTALPVVKKLGEAYLSEYPNARLEFDTGTNSGAAIRGVLEGTLELAVANRPLSDEEAAQPLEEHPFARDAVVFAVHLPNPVNGLTSAQVRDIYAGRLTDWSLVGGLEEPIVLLDRDEDESMRKLVLVPLMGDDTVSAQTVVLSRAGDMAEALENTDNSLGYSSICLLNALEAEGVRVLALDGVTPSSESIRQDLYPWQLTFRLVHSDDAPAEVRRFVDFAEGPQGLQVVEQYGCAAINQ